MAIRDTSIPHPTAPAPPVPPTLPSSDLALPQHNHELNVDTIPPIPVSRARATDGLSLHDMGNPWQQEEAPEPRSDFPSNSEYKTIPFPGTTDGKHESQSNPDAAAAIWSKQETPRSSLDSDRSKEFWESSDDEDEKKSAHSATNIGTAKKDGIGRNIPIPASLQVKRKPISPRSAQKQSSSSADQDFASNNPFRQHATEISTTADDDWLHVGNVDEKTSQSGPALTALSSQPNNASAVAPLIGISDLDDSPWETVAGTTPPPPASLPPPVPLSLVPGRRSSPTPQPHSPFSEQPPLIPVRADQADDVNPWATRSTDPSPSFTTKTGQTTSLLDQNSDLVKGASSISLEGGPNMRSDHVSASSLQPPFSLLDETSVPKDILSGVHNIRDQGQEVFVPPAGPPPSQSNLRIGISNVAPVKPPRVAQVVKPLSEAELAEMQEQRKETYQIKHFRWFDHRLHKLRSSSMLTQNKNGPCPLLALVNALILGAQDQDQAVLDQFLSTREQVTLGTIIENLMMELLASSGDGGLPDVDELNRFLLKLRTGMNMNPKMVPSTSSAPNLMDAQNSVLHLPQDQHTQNKPGTFMPSQDLQLYSAFGVQTVHGWLAEPGSDAAGAFERSAQNYEDAQAKLFGEDELEFKLTRNGLTPEEQVIWEDIVSMKHFLQSNPTQLTQYGIECIKSWMKPGTFSVLFRNDHFSTIYKHPQDGQLYSLITDAGYAERDEVIWESLVDISGQNSEFFSGDFKSVSHAAQHSTMASYRRSSQYGAQSASTDPQVPLSPVQRQEQEDADLAMAMQLQEEENQRERQRRNETNSNSNSSAEVATPGTQSQPNNRPPGRRTASGIQIPVRASGTSTGAGINNPLTELRPTVPPRVSRPGVNRPADAIDADAPPAYEEAARGKAYHPPLGSPLHPASSAAGDRNTFVGSTSTLNLNDPANSVASTANRQGRPRDRRRSSAYAENTEYQNRASGQTSGTTNDGPSPAYDLTDGRMPGSYIHTGHGGHGQSIGYANTGPYTNQYGSQGQRQRDRDRDCIVM